MKGTCQAMCSFREAREREQQGDVAVFETTAETRGLRRSLRRVDLGRAVKRFRRAADGRAEGPEDVRPMEWLERTVAHLWNVGREEFMAAAAGQKGEEEVEGGWLVELHDFVADRLQAVRKDLVIQGLNGARAIALFERVVRFHALFGYLLAQQAAPVYDEHLGLTALRSGLGTLIDLYKEAALSSSSPSSSQPGAAGLGLGHVDEFLAYNLLVQAYDAVRASGGGSGAVEAAGWGKLLLLLRRSLVAINGSNTAFEQLPPRTGLALRVVVALATENYLGFLRLFRRLPPPGAAATSSTKPEPAAILLRCVLHRLLPFVRRRVLDVWSKTLFKKERMPLAELARLLCFDSPAQAKAFAALHGVAIVEPVSLDAWGDDETGGGGSGTGAAVYIEPRLATVALPAVGQTYEERRRQQRALAPRQDGLVLGNGMGLAAVWDALKH